MLQEGHRIYERLRHWLAWIGLFTMLVSFVWLQLFPGAERAEITDSRSDSQDNSFALVVIDPGHGGQDSGAMHSGVLEKDLTLDVARRVARFVQQQGFSTLFTRTGDESVSLASRVATANQERDCIFVSIHFDEGTRPEASGVETFYAVQQLSEAPLASSWLPFLRRTSTETPSFESQSLAGFIQEALVSRTQAFNRGTRAQQFFVIAKVRHPAVLVEGGFLTNQADVGRLATEDYRERMAAAISDGILRYREVAGEGPAALAATKPES